MGDANPTSAARDRADVENFERDVIERSRSVPVVMDFWAPWCGPCVRLGPLLEKLAKEYDGKFVLAKVDTEREPGLAAQFGVRSIPAVFGVRDGKAVDGFVGLQPEAAIRAWLDRLLAVAGRADRRTRAGAGGNRPEGRRGQVQFRTRRSTRISRLHESGWRGSHSRRAGWKMLRRRLPVSSGGVISSPRPRSSRPS